MVYDGNPADAVKLYVGDVYIQHNPLVEGIANNHLSIILKKGRGIP
jgi:predicted SnoaL-like aldol condensation-catalyzing enzyme